MGLFTNKYKICVNEIAKELIKKLVLTGDKSIDQTLAARKIDFYSTNILAESLKELKCSNIEKYQKMFKSIVEEYVNNYQAYDTNQENSIYNEYQNRIIETFNSQLPNNKKEDKLNKIIKEAKKNINDQSLIIMLEHLIEKYKDEITYQQISKSSTEISQRLNDYNNSLHDLNELESMLQEYNHRNDNNQTTKRY